MSNEPMSDKNPKLDKVKAITIKESIIAILKFAEYKIPPPKTSQSLFLNLTFLFGSVNLNTKDKRTILKFLQAYVKGYVTSSTPFTSYKESFKMFLQVLFKFHVHKKDYKVTLISLLEPALQKFTETIADISLTILEQDQLNEFFLYFFSVFFPFKQTHTLYTTEEISYLLIDSFYVYFRIHHVYITSELRRFSPFIVLTYNAIYKHRKVKKIVLRGLDLVHEIITKTGDSREYFVGVYTNTFRVFKEFRKKEIIGKNFMVFEVLLESSCVDKINGLNEKYQKNVNEFVRNIRAFKSLELIKNVLEDENLLNLFPENIIRICSMCLTKSSILFNSILHVFYEPFFIMGCEREKIPIQIDNNNSNINERFYKLLVDLPKFVNVDPLKIFKKMKILNGYLQLELIDNALLVLNINNIFLLINLFFKFDKKTYRLKYFKELDECVFLFFNLINNNLSNNDLVNLCVDNVKKTQFLFILSELECFVDYRLFDWDNIESDLENLLILRNIKNISNRLTEEKEKLKFLRYILFKLLTQLGSKNPKIVEKVVEILRHISVSIFEYTDLTELITKNSDFVIDDLIYNLQYNIPGTFLILDNIFKFIEKDTKMIDIIQVQLIDNHYLYVKDIKRIKLLLNIFHNIIKLKRDNIFVVLIDLVNFYGYNDLFIRNRVIDILLEFMKKDISEKEMKKSEIFQIINSLWHSFYLTIKREKCLELKVKLLKFIMILINKYNDFMFSKIRDNLCIFLKDNLLRKNLEEEYILTIIDLFCVFLNKDTVSWLRVSREIGKFDIWQIVKLFSRFFNCKLYSIEIQKRNKKLFKIINKYSPDQVWYLIQSSRNEIIKSNSVLPDIRIEKIEGIDYENIKDNLCKCLD